MMFTVYLLEHNVAFPKREPAFQYGLPFGDMKEQPISDSKLFDDIEWNVVEKNIASVKRWGWEWLHDEYIFSPAYQAICIIYENEAMYHHAVDLRSEINKNYYY